MSAKKKPQKSLDKWTKQKWRTPSGKKSSETGEVYAPEAKIKKLKPNGPIISILPLSIVLKLVL